MRRILSLALLFSLVTHVYGQLTVNNNAPYATPQDWVQNILLGQGVTVSNVTYTGATNACGFFDGSNMPMNNIGLDSGLLMTSGTINNALGPNLAGATTGNNSTPGDPDLATISGVNSNDAAVLEFDFVPTNDTLKFNYVFASEEYPEFANSSVNDAFGFFLSGPGITGPFANGAVNIALIPGTTTPVSINTVNPTVNPAFYNPNGAAFNGAGNATQNPDLQYDAYTVVFTAQYVLTPCQTYHIKLAIGDGGDAAYDSGVFLEQGSFSSYGPSVTVPTANKTGFGNDSTYYEGCGPVEFIFKRQQNIANADTMHYEILGSATNGVDYQFIPDSVIFLPGVDTVSLFIDIYNDSINESMEELKIRLVDSLQCQPLLDSASVYIVDPQDLIMNSITQDTIMCTDNNIPIEIVPDTGIYPLSYQWSNGDTNNSFVVPSIIQDTNFIVTVTDACGIDTLIDTARVIVDNPPTSIETPGDTIDCESPGTQVEVFTNDPMPGLQYSWSNNQTTTSFFQNNPYITTNYVVTVTQNCANYFLTDTFTLFVDNPPFTLETQDDTINCTDPPVTIGPEVSYTTPNFSFQWGNGSQDSSITVQPTSSTTYVVSVTDACGYRTVTDSITVYVDNDPIITSTENELINCVGDSADMEVQIQGGYPPYSIQWSSGGTDSIETVAGTSGTQTYTVSVTDVCQLDTVTEQVNVVVRDYEDLQIAPLQNETLLCKGDQFEIGPAQVLGGSGDNVVSWNNWDDETNLAWGVTDTNITFTIRAADLCNLDSTQTTVQIIVPDYDPMDLTTTNDTFICPSDEVTIGALTTGGAENEGYEYNWGNGKTGDQILVSPNQSRTYYVTATDVCGHEAYAEVFVESSAPTADFEFEFIDPFNVMFENKSTLADSFSWNFGDGNTDSFKDPMHQYEEDVTHNVTLKAINEYGCYDTTTKELNPPLVAFIPNAFTPNGDGLNDVFELNGGGIRSSENIQKFNIAIFDRWGTEIFFSNDPNFKWDGIDQNNGQKVSVGVYPFKLTIEGYGTQKIEMTGSITIPSVD
jgi:gliding motility-associated-like protein